MLYYSYNMNKEPEDISMVQGSRVYPNQNPKTTLTDPIKDPLGSNQGAPLEEPEPYTLSP